MCLLSLSMLFFSCNQNNDSTNKKPTPTPQGDAELGKPTELKVHDVKTKLEDWTVEVPNDKTSVKTGDVKATFAIGGKNEELTPEVKNSPVALVAGTPVDIVLMVPAVNGKYKSWTQTIKVTQAVNKDPELVLVKDTFDILDKDDKINFVDDTHIEVLLEENKETLTMDDIDAEFTANGKKVKVTLKTEPALPITNLEKGKPRDITLKVDAKKGSYKAWQCNLKITRATLPKLKLKKLTVHDIPASIAEEIKCSIRLPDIKTVESKDVKATFTLKGQPVNDVTFNVQDLPCTLEDEQSKTFKCSVAEKSGEYQKWEGELTITHIKRVPAKVTVELTKEDDKIVKITTEGQEVKMKSETGKLFISSAVNGEIITKATVGGQPVQISATKMYVQTDVKPAERIDIELEFKEHSPFRTWFKLVKEN